MKLCTLLQTIMLFFDELHALNTLFMILKMKP